MKPAAINWKFNSKQFLYKKLFSSSKNADLADFFSECLKPNQTKPSCFKIFLSDFSVRLDTPTSFQVPFYQLCYIPTPVDLLDLVPSRAGSDILIEIALV